MKQCAVKMKSVQKSIPPTCAVPDRGHLTAVRSTLACTLVGARERGRICAAACVRVGPRLCGWINFVTALLSRVVLQQTSQRRFLRACRASA